MRIDTSSVTSHFPNPQDGFTTTTSGTVSSGAATVGLNSTGDYSNGDVVVLVIDPTDVDKKQVFVGTIDTSGVQVTNVVWVGGTNQSHSVGATVVDYYDAAHVRMMTKGILVHADQDGTLKAGAVDVASVLANNVVTTDKILDDAVTAAKVSGFDKSNLTTDSNPYKFHAYRNSAWTGNSGKINLDAEAFDTNSNFDATTNNRYDVPVNGFYQINFGAASAQNSGTGYGCYIQKNGTTVVLAGSQVIATQTTPFEVRTGGAGLIQLNAGDYLELFYNGGGSVTGSTGSAATFMSGHLESRT